MNPVQGFLDMNDLFSWKDASFYAPVFYHICIHLNLYCHAYHGKWQAIEIVMVVLSAYKIRQLNVVMNFNHNKTICIYMQI